MVLGQSHPACTDRGDRQDTQNTKGRENTRKKGKQTELTQPNSLSVCVCVIKVRLCTPLKTCRQLIVSFFFKRKG